MDIKSLKAKIKAKQLPPYLIFSGEEWKVQQIYIKQIAKVTGKEVKYIDSISDIYSKLKNRSFVANTYVYVVRDDKDLMQNEKLQNQIEEVVGDNILIHLLTNVDKRTKFYKAYKAFICDFQRLSDSMLEKYVLKEITLNKRNLTLLIDSCEHDYGRILLEIDKIKRYTQHALTLGDNAGGNSFDLTFEQLLGDGTIYQPPYDAIFDLVDAILNRKVNRAFDLLQQSYEVGEVTMVMLTVLYNNAKAVLQIQSYDGDNLSKATGLTGWQIKNAKCHVNKYSDEELVHMLQLIHKVERGIKIGKMEDAFAMQYLLVKIL